MERKIIEKLSTNVPVLKNKLHFSSLPSQRGATYRKWVIGLSAISFLLILDKFYIMRLGYNQPVLRSEFKVKPDYLTQTLFVGERKELPEFKNI